METIYFLLFTLLFVLTVHAADHCYSSECREQRRQAVIIKGYQHEVTRLTQLSEQSGCSVCNIEGITPCYNNGTCHVSTPYNYTCECPYNTAGIRCETILSCERNDCGINAKCYVVNHLKVCQCLPGYTGDPYKDCTLRTKKASLVTDPHYTTFDGTIFDYMGTCPYYVMKACNSSIDFSIISSSFIPSGSTNYKTYVSDMTFKTQGHEFRVDNYLKFYIDGVF